MQFRVTRMTAPPPPTPIHLLRAHTSSVTSLSFSDDNERLYSGDSSGLVIVTSTSSLRAIASWNAHTDSLLGVEEWGDRIITYVCVPFRAGDRSRTCSNRRRRIVDMRGTTNCMCGHGSRSCRPLLGSGGLPRNLTCRYLCYVTLWMSMR